MSQHLRSLEQLGLEFERVARQAERPARIRRRGIVAGVIVATTISAGAIAATTGILDGAPVSDPPGLPAQRTDSGSGIVRVPSAMLTSLRVPDPAGGPPWGLRTMTTRRGYGCVQLGRVVNGRLGLLGQDGVNADDGRFHELSPDDRAGSSCNLLDGGGTLYIAVASPAADSGSDGGCWTIGPSRWQLQHRPKLWRRILAKTPVCPAADRRTAYYGTLGPQATSVTYRDQGALRTSRTVGPWGAYLVVVRPDAQQPRLFDTQVAAGPDQGLVAVTYRDGHRCTVPPPLVDRVPAACPAVGSVPAKATRPPAPGEVTAPVTARVSRRPQRPVGLYGNSQPKVHILTVTFRARVAAGPRGDYQIAWRGCPNTAGATQVGRDVRAGELVRMRLNLPANCHGRALEGLVLLLPESASAPTIAPPPPPQPSTDPSDPFPLPQPSRATPLVGRFTAVVPPR